MIFKLQQMLEEINKYLAITQYYIYNQNSIGRFDINKYCEDVFCNLLNIIYDLNLINLNHIKFNFPIADLGDYDKRVCFQVTSTNDINKIRYTVNEFINKKSYNDFDRLIIFILGNKKSYRANINISEEFNFDILNDVISINDLPRIIYNFSEEKIESILSYLKRTIIFYSTNIEMDRKLFDDFNKDIRNFIKIFQTTYITVGATPEKLIYNIDFVVGDWRLPDRKFSLNILNEKKEIIIDCLNKLSYYLSSPIYFQSHTAVEGYIMPLKDPKRVNYNRMRNDTFNISRDLIKAYEDLCDIIYGK